MKNEQKDSLHHPFSLPLLFDNNIMVFSERKSFRNKKSVFSPANVFLRFYSKQLTYLPDVIQWHFFFFHI
uniref:Uncharacterized protein n=1 Tax=Rhizophora mucronata TaxID=61149 RepID=A0A2P2LKV4_RHIMU